MVRLLVAGRLWAPRGVTRSAQWRAGSWSMGVFLAVTDEAGAGPASAADVGRLWCVSVQIDGLACYWGSGTFAGSFDLVDGSGRAVRWTVERVMAWVRSVLVDHSALAVCQVSVSIADGAKMAGRWSQRRRDALGPVDAAMNAAAMVAQAVELEDAAALMDEQTKRRAQWLARASALRGVAGSLVEVRQAVDTSPVVPPPPPPPPPDGGGQ